jgi:hypothetical protein
VADPEDPNYPETLLIGSNSVKRPQAITFPITPSGPGGANICCIYSGTTTRELRGTSPGAWLRAKMALTLPTEGRKWTNDASLGSGWTLLIDGSAVAAPASLYNAGESNYAGWAVDGAWLEVEPPGEFGHTGVLRLAGHVAVRDNDGYLYRIAYQAIVLGRTL